MLAWPPCFPDCLYTVWNTPEHIAKDTSYGRLLIGHGLSDVCVSIGRGPLAVCASKTWYQCHGWGPCTRYIQTRLYSRRHFSQSTRYPCQGSHSHGKAWKKILSWKMGGKNKVVEIQKGHGKVMEFLQVLLIANHAWEIPIIPYL